MNADRKKHDYDVALSFAGEDRAYVEMVAEQLRARGVSVFYDRYEQAGLWGKDLFVHLTHVYREKAKFTLMFCSHAYSEKLWTNHERRAAQARALEGAEDYILPARFDDTEIPGLLPTTGHIDLRTHSPVEVALLVCDKLGVNVDKLKANQVPSPRSPAMTGEVSFDYSSHDGKFRIGEGLCEFETSWNKASDRRIYCTNDGKSVQGVALAPKDATPRDLSDVTQLDFSSRARCPELDRFVVLRNQRGVFALLKILELRDERAVQIKTCSGSDTGYWPMEVQTFPNSSCRKNTPDRSGRSGGNQVDR